MAKFELLDSAKGSVAEYEGEKLFAVANAPDMVEVRDDKNHTTAFIRLAAGQSVKEKTR
jgi:hypothetical protein